MMRYQKMLLGVVSAIMGIAQSQAAPVIPGGSIPTGPPISVDPISGDSGNFSTAASWSTAKIVGGKSVKTTYGSISLVNAAYTDPVTHNLDFFYQIQNNYVGPTTASDTLSTSIQLLAFAGFSTNVFQIVNTTPGAAALFGTPGATFRKPTGDSISSVATSADGSKLTINFSSVLAPKTNSAIIEIKTNAKNFDTLGDAKFSWLGAPTAAPGSTNLSGAASTRLFDINSLEPVATPEPGFYGVLSAGLLGVFLVTRRPSKARAAS